MYCTTISSEINVKMLEVCIPTATNESHRKEENGYIGHAPVKYVNKNQRCQVYVPPPGHQCHHGGVESGVYGGKEIYDLCIHSQVEVILPPYALKKFNWKLYQSAEI